MTVPTLVERQVVEATEPTIYIGHRLMSKKNGTRKVSPKWHAEYCLDGRQRYIALKTTVRDAAIRAAHKLANRLQLGDEPVVKRHVEIADLAKQYMEMQTNKGRAPKTIEKYTYVLNTFVKWATKAGKTSAAKITSKEFWDFVKFMTDKKLTAKTRYDRSIVIKQLFKWAARKKLISHDPLVGETLPEPQPTQQPCFRPEQVQALLANADPEHEGPFFAFLAYAGLRFGECQQLRWDDLTLNDDGTGHILVQRGGSGETTKGRRSRTIPIHPELRKVIDRLPRKFETIFTARPSPKHPNGGAMIAERRLLLALKRLCRRCEFPNPDQYKLHTFRHAFASMLAMDRTTHSYALALMGHKSSDIFNMYFTMNDEVARKAISTITYAKKGASDVNAA